MRGYVCMPLEDPAWEALSAQQRSVYSELVRHMKWRAEQHLLGNRKIVVPRGHTIFSQAGLARKAKVEPTLARMTVDRLVELGVVEKITAYTEAQLPEKKGPVIQGAIAPLIEPTSQAHRQPTSVVRFVNPDVYISYWEAKSKDTSEPEIEPVIDPSIGPGVKKVN